MNTFETDAAFVAHTYARFPLEIVGGKGSVLTGSDGKSYIDLGNSGSGTITSSKFSDTEYAEITNNH